MRQIFNFLLGIILYINMADAQMCNVYIHTNTFNGGAYSSVCDGCLCPYIESYWLDQTVSEFRSNRHLETCEILPGWATHFIINENGNALIIQTLDGVIENTITGISNSPNGVIAETPLTFSSTTGIRLNGEIHFFEAIEWIHNEDGFIVRFHQLCDANLDGLVDVTDIFVFLTFWFVGASRADIDANGIVEVVDIFTFLTRWFES